MKYAQQIALLCLLFVGCAQYIWKHPEHSDQARFNRDAYECERDMRQSGYYGGGIVGQINAQGFAERCMFARGYYKVSRDQVQQQSQLTATPALATPPLVGLAPPPTAPASIQSAPAISPPAAPAVTRRFAQLFLVRGKIVSTPPQTFTAEFLDETRKATVELAGRRLLQGDFELFPLSASISSKLRIVKPGSIKTLAGADTKGLARFSDLDLELECAYMFVSSTGRGSGVCTDTQGNGYQITF
jgi:hypothetical protein